jgi:leucyl aminopeptidase
LIRHLLAAPPKTGRGAFVFVHAGKKAVAPKHLNSWFKADKSQETHAVRHFYSESEARLLLTPLAAAENEIDASLKASIATRFRDAVGASVGQLEKWDVQWAEFNFDVDAKTLQAALLGLEIALYRFKRVFKNEEPKLNLILKHKGHVLTAAAVKDAALLGHSVNLARHVVNLPPNLLNPESYADAAIQLFQGAKNVKVEIWQGAKLAKEKMGLLMAVGQGSASAPRMVHIRYRPPGAKGAPIAFVGKGITFDTGGLDIKPSSGMRLMKKDMGGSGAVLALAYWAAQSGVKKSLDVYLALAENAVSADSFRPSDVVVSRSGQSVEIHNTDAEGRLVLADVLDVAVTQKEKPRYVIDVATLTGAIKVALGSGLAGLFSTDARLARTLHAAGQEAGDLTWIMPLFQKYRSHLNSPFADMVNATDGFGGAVTAALFLEKFVKDVPWAHLDIYAWKDGADGAWIESGGSGQSVLGLAHWLETVK